MPPTTGATDLAMRPAAPISLDLRRRALSLGEAGSALEALASDLRALWTSALKRGDFNEITRLVEASHAIHRAAIALRTDSLIPIR
jgi:hypothetical protein